MSRARRLHRYTYADYVALEDESPTKHEFLDGEIYAMAGGSEEHSALAAEVLRALGNAIGTRPCRAHTLALFAVAACAGSDPAPPVATQAPALEETPVQSSDAGTPSPRIALSALFSYEEGADRVDFIRPRTTRIATKSGKTCENDLPDGGNMYSGKEVEDAFMHADVQKALGSHATFGGTLDAVLKAPNRPGSVTWSTTCTTCTDAPDGLADFYKVMEVVMRNRRLLCP